MTPQRLAEIPRRTARDVMLSVRLGPSVQERTVLAVEVAMNEEWWRGYYAGRGVAESSSPLPFSHISDEESVEPNGVQLLVKLVKDCQDILTGYLVPDGYDADKAVEHLLEILDGPRWRAARDALKRHGFST